MKIAIRENKFREIQKKLPNRKKNFICKANPKKVTSYFKTNKL